MTNPIPSTEASWVPKDAADSAEVFLASDAEGGAWPGMKAHAANLARDVLRLAARTRELEAEKTRLESRLTDEIAACRPAVEVAQAEVATLRAEVERLGTERRTGDAMLGQWQERVRVAEQYVADTVKETDALRARLAETEAALVGLREAATKVAEAWGPSGEHRPSTITSSRRSLTPPPSVPV